jgi:hypothetical protein
MRRRAPKLPKAPYNPDAGEEMVPPKEEDTDDPDTPKASDKQDSEKGKKADKDKEDEEEPLYMPALGGPRPKLDPRFKGKMRPGERRARKSEGDKDSNDRDELAQRQAETMQELDAAEQSLGSDQQSLERMLDQLRQAIEQGKGGKQGSNKEGSESSSSQSLAQAMQSQAMQEAQAMAARMNQLAQGRSTGRGRGRPGLPMPSRSAIGNLQGTPRDGLGSAELADLDPATRSVILKMQPKLREELLQGMQGQGPEGYRKFIQDYFKRLSQEKSTK